MERTIDNETDTMTNQDGISGNELCVTNSRVDLSSVYEIKMGKNNT